MSIHDEHDESNMKRCIQCDSAFKTNDKLKRHQRIHTKEKPFACIFCEKVFSQSGHLKEHQLIYSGDRPYGCPECKKSFTTDQKLKNHQGWLKVHYNVWNQTFKYEKNELLVCIYEIPRELVFIYGISGHSGWSSPFGSLHVLHVLWSSIDVSIKD